MEIIDEKTIKLERELNDLDAFVLDFIKGANIKIGVNGVLKS